MRWSQGPTPAPLAPVSQARESRPQPYSAPQLAGQKHGFALSKWAWTGLDARGHPTGRLILAPLLGGASPSPSNLAELQNQIEQTFLPSPN